MVPYFKEIYNNDLAELGIRAVNLLLSTFTPGLKDLKSIDCFCWVEFQRYCLMQTVKGVIQIILTISNYTILLSYKV